MLTLAGEGSTPGGVDDRDLVIQSGANGLINSASSVIDLQGRLGAQQEAVERASVESAAEQFGLEQTYNALTTADTFEAASRLEEVQTQLEMLYIITARTSQLNLATYLR